MTQERIVDQSTISGTKADVVAQPRFRHPVNDGKFYIKPAHAPNLSVQLAVKRMLDIVLALSGLLVLAPVFLLIATVIKTGSKGPVFFRHICLGLDGIPFEILTFRCLYTNPSDVHGVRYSPPAGQRITPIGTILHRSGFHKLPQLWNVLRGDMSMIGPPPHVPDFRAVDRAYTDFVEGYDYRHLLRPGITGLAQSRGLGGPPAQRWMAIRRVACDVTYVREFSLLLDMKIAARSFFNMMKRGQAFQAPSYL